MKKLFVALTLTCLSVDVFASPVNSAKNILLDAINLAARKTDNKLVDGMNELEDIMFGGSLDSLSSKDVIKLRGEGFDPSKLSTSWKAYEKHAENRHPSEKMHSITYLWGSSRQGIGKHIQEHPDSPLVSRWLDVPEMQKTVMNTIENYPLDRDYFKSFFTGKWDVLLKYWRVANPHQVDLLGGKIKESFDRIVGLSGSDPGVHIFEDIFKDRFMATVLDASDESENFREYFESLIESCCNQYQ